MTRHPIRPSVAFALDVVLVLLFALVGRRSHQEAGTLGAVIGTAWPFLVGLAVGWGATYLTRRHAPLSLVDGVPVWLLTVSVGMLLRAATGSGTAVSFILVALGTTGLVLLGWRLLAELTMRRRSREAATL